MGPTRPEYEALARHFRELAAPFGLRVDERVERALVLVVAAFEAADRHVDATSDPTERLDLCAAILGVLREASADVRVPGDLAPVLRDLRAHLVAFDAVCAFTGHLARFMVCTEALRRARSGDEFLACVLDEARGAALMTLVAVPEVDSPAFARFFHVLSEVANLTDKLHDVRGDHARGEIALRPGLALHLRLFGAFVGRLPRLLSLSPSPLRLVAWGLRYLVPPAGAHDSGAGASVS